MTIPQRGGLPHSDIHGSTPARGSPWLFAACHVLHRLLVPRHPPNALIALKINGPSSSSRNHLRQTHHTQHASVRTAAADWNRRRSQTGQAPWQASHSAQNNIASERVARPLASPLAEIHRSDACNRAHPETHQNLIHPDKDRIVVQPTGRTGATAAQCMRAERSSSLRYTPQPGKDAPWWRRSGSNRRPPACKAGALPAELRPQGRTGLRPDPPGPWAPDPINGFQRPPTSIAASGGIIGAKPPALLAWWAREDLNLRPHAYQACALTS